VILQQRDVADALAQQVSAELASDRWLSTHSVAHSLMAMARHVGEGKSGPFAFERRVGAAPTEVVRSRTPVYASRLDGFPDAGGTVAVKNTGDRKLFASIVVRGVPESGTETAAASGLRLDVEYVDETGLPVDVRRLHQGQDIVARVTVTNTGAAQIDNVALTQMVPAGWEIHNTRLASSSGEKPDLDHEDFRDDRLLRYFSLLPHQTKTFTTTVNAAYLGRYYLPALSAEAMYDASIQARLPGQWVEVARQ
jgi:uncharacterized repeat protein (TIGR01451 family)